MEIIAYPQDCTSSFFASDTDADDVGNLVSGMVLQSKAKEMVMLADTLGQSLLFGSSLHIGAENDEERASKAENPNHRSVFAISVAALGNAYFT
ncbi:hypothetical protein Tsubulata_025063 [Turnera subulata]|uniref:Uncharacterized protein n=1 Tax=Turnera subulata TaxID=218843 RepID=A0A9Q0J4W6_9ROSI|nr:hypothetical protein Tsubulata_025063 [Turnera subulata]